MDFSSSTRALSSLVRRTPQIDDEKVLEWSQKMLDDRQNATLEGDLYLLQCESSSKRWEVLAVGLFVGTELLQQQQAKPGKGDDSQEAMAGEATAERTVVYTDGPRVPKQVAVPATDTTNSIPAGTATGSAGSSAAEVVKLNEGEIVALCKTLHGTCKQHLEHSEPRIRTLVAKAVGAQVTYAFQSNNSKLMDNCLLMHTLLIQSIQEHIESGRDIAQDAELAEQKQQEEKEAEIDESGVARKTTVLDDTTGWRALETNWQCLACWIQASMEHYVTLFLIQPPSDNNQQFHLFDNLKFSCNDHVNRHVRAAGMLVLEHLINAVESSSKDIFDEVLGTPTSKLRKTVIAVLKNGLADNWSQVRMAASVLCRKFLSAILLSKHNNSNDEQEIAPVIDNTHHKDWMNLLIPRMCLNRFYLAQGVKLYSHETWKIVFGYNGINFVEQTIGPVCRYYVKMCDADNHVVREAACQAVAELVTKFGGQSQLLETSEEDQTRRKQLLLSFVPLLLQALIMCFHDESWPVRDEACLACGTFVKVYPKECEAEFKKTLLERFIEQLTDQIWSVREDAAIALGDTIDAYGEKFFYNTIKPTLIKLLPSAKDQPSMSYEEYKRKHNDIESHTNLQTYSCGSLAPKMRKGGAGRLGCSSCGITRPKAPWEATDGCVYLIRELCIRCTDNDENTSGIKLNDQELLPIMTNLVDTCRVQHFPQGDDLRTTLWKQLPVIAMSLGKQRFKRLYLELFLDLLMSNLERSTASELSKHAAGQCLEELGKLVGPNILRGRLSDDYQQRTYDKVMAERQMMRGGHGDPTLVGAGGGHFPMGPPATFSPFGPPGLLDAVWKKP